MNPPLPPQPELLRRPAGSFGWLDACLLHEGWLQDLGPDGCAVLLLLALAADRRGASFFGRDRMARALGMQRASVDRALGVMLELALVDHRPWRPGNPDGVWQLLPVPPRRRPTLIVTPPSDVRRGRSVSIAQALASLGLAGLPAPAPNIRGS